MITETNNIAYVLAINNNFYATRNRSIFVFLPSPLRTNKCVLLFYLAGCTGTWGETSRCQADTGSRWGQTTGTSSLLQAQQSVSYTSLHGHHTCALINRPTDFKWINILSFSLTHYPYNNRAILICIVKCIFYR